MGGSVKWNKDKTDYELTFKNARYWSNSLHWQWAKFPNTREKASFLKDNILPIEQSGHLFFVDKIKEGWSNFFDILQVNGHTEAQMIPHIKYKDTVIVFAADLLPSIGHIPLPYVMGYDTRPLLTLSEKKDFLDKAVKHNYVIFLQHDYQHECCTLKLTDKGVRLDRTFRLQEIL